MNIGLIGPGEIGSVICQKIKRCRLPSQNGKFARPRVSKRPRSETRGQSPQHDFLKGFDGGGTSRWK